MVFVVSNDLLTMFVALEVLSLPLYLLWNLGILTLGREILLLWLPASYTWALTGVYLFGAVGWLALVLVLLFARRTVVGGDEVTIHINGDASPPIHAERGGSLLKALRGHDVLVPAACGGQGIFEM